MKRYRETFNDGILVYGKKTTNRSSTGKKLGEIFQELGKLFYKEMSCRETDYKIANEADSSLDLKVRTLCPPHLQNVNKNSFSIRIKDEDFDIIKVDKDRVNNYLYFYLSKVGSNSE